MNTEKGCIGVLAGSVSDLSDIDFSPWALKCYHINSRKLRSYVKTHSAKDKFKDNWRTIFNQSRHDGDRPFWDPENLNILMPIDLNHLPTIEDVFDCRLALLVLFPSDITVLSIHDLVIVDENLFECSPSLGFEFAPLQRYYKAFHHHLRYHKKELKEVNSFLAQYKKNAWTLKYVGTALNFYSTAWRVNVIEMSFVCLCIALEGIVPGKEQLTFRFRRNLAVLCGDDEMSSKIIYDSANQLYGLRSRIVHSSVKSSDFENFDQFHEYAKGLASRMIIEMILQNVQSISLLDERLTNLGFGNRDKISNDYQPLIGNLIVYTNVLWTDLPKLK